MQILYGQTLPPYLIDTFPAPNATGVPTNVSILLRARVPLPIPPFAAAPYYTLKAGTGAPLSFTPLYNCICFVTVLAPSAPLSPNTLYTFTVNPGTDIGAPYSFTFTTGASTDNAPPHLLSVDPPSGATGLGLSGPIKFHFDKRITRMIQQGIKVTALPSYLYSYYPSPTLSDDGTTLVVRIAINGYPTAYDITVDPTQFVDSFGNPGEGTPITAHYLTFITTDSTGPHLKSSLPADGDTGVPTNVTPRLIFQNNIDNTTASKGIELRAGDTGQPISFTFSNDPSHPNNGSVLAINPSKLLAPNQTYSIVVNSDLRDPSGFPVQQPRTIQFTTGPGPDVIAPVALGYSPPAQAVPPNVRVLIRTNKPIAPIVLDRLATFGLAYGQFNEHPVPVSATLSADGTLLTLIPLAPLPSQYYAVATSEIVDTSGAAFHFGSAISFSISGNEDHDPPVLLAVNPPANSESVPLSTDIQLRFNKVCATCFFPGTIMVSANGGSLPLKILADYQSGNTSFTVNAGGLSPSTTYTVSVSGIMSLTGDLMPDYSFSFTTASGTTLVPPLKLLDSSVANGDVGVNPSGPFLFHYDSILNQVSAVTSASISGPSNFMYPVQASASDSLLTVIPATTLPANTTFLLTCSITSVLGSYNQTKITFTTAASDDTTRPVVTSITPGDGALTQTPASFVLSFSKPLNPSTITADSISLYSAGARFSSGLVRAEDNRSVSLTLPNVSLSAVSVIASSEVKDLAGNSLVPFEANYPVSQTAFQGRTFVHEMRPPSGSTGVAPDTPVTWFLDQPVDLAAIQANLLVLVDYTPISGSFDLSGGGRILRFSPANPFPAGAFVSFYERTSIIGLNNYTFTIALPPDPVLRFVRTTLGYSAALDSVFEIEFTQDPPLGKNIAALSYSTGNGFSRSIAFTESIPRSHVLRLTTTAPRLPGYYAVTLSNQVIGDINAPRYLYATIAAATTVGGSPTVASVGPVAGSTDVPLNTTVRVLFGAQINPLTVTFRSAVLSVNGQVLSVERTFPINNREIILRPLRALPPNSRVDVLLTGLEDLAGRAIPTSSWSFTTGADIDVTPPYLLSTSLAYGSGVLVEIAANEAVQMVFSKAIDPGIMLQIGSDSGWQDSAATVTLSNDLRLLTITPVHAWAKGQRYRLNLNYFTDLSGNSGTGDSNFPTTFQVAFDPSTTPLRLLAISPPDASTAMPLNAKVMAAFDKPVNVPPDGVRLTDSDGKLVPLVRQYSGDPSLVIFAPQNALRPDALYSLSLSGASDMSGNPMASVASVSFQTGEAPDYVAPTGSVNIVSPLPTNMPLRIRFSERITPATVTPQQIQLLAGSVLQPADLVLSGDGLSITVNPRQPLIPGKSYTLNVVLLTDFAGNAATFDVNSPFRGSTTNFSASDSPDTQPPIITIFPPDGTVGFPATRSFSYPVSSPIGATYSKPADLRVSTPLLRVLRDGVPVPGTVTSALNRVTFTPSPPLDYNTTYRIEVSNVVDYIGNAATPASATFTTSQSAAADLAPFRVTSMQPADGGVGIANDSPIVVSFTKLLDPANATFQIRSSPYVPIFGHWSVDRSYLTFTPNEPWPSAATISVFVARQTPFNYFRDLSGTTLDRDYAFSFTTAVLPDNTPPALVSITPSPGTPISPGSTTFTLVFSKRIFVENQSLQAFNGSQTASLDAFYNQSSHSISANVYRVVADSVLTIIGTGGIHDDSGNSITPFSFQYPTLKTDETGRPSVVSVSPNGNATNVPPSTPIKIQFNKALDPNSLPASVRITENGDEILGQLQVLDSNHSVQFTPNVPYKAGSRIDVFVLTTAVDFDGVGLYQRYQSYFTVAGTAGTAPEPQRMSVSHAGFGAAVTPGAALDLAFDGELDPSTVSEGNVWLRAGHTRIPGTAVLRGSRAIRFQPAEPLRAGEQYVLTAGPSLRSAEGLPNEPREFRFQVDPSAPEVRVESIEYVHDLGPLAVRIRFTGPVSAISADGLKLLAEDGSIVRAPARFSTDGREWLLMLPMRQPVRVVLDGVEDRWGRKLPGESRDPVMAR